MHEKMSSMYIVNLRFSPKNFKMGLKNVLNINHINGDFTSNIIHLLL